ncbi:MAG: hypothetical protein IKV94_03890 [Clostridia bacterium]|nr:hypothetical protein [Clostridia bacterium]
MKKFIVVTISCLIVIVGVYLISTTTLLKDLYVKMYDIETDVYVTDDNIYFTQLSNVEKEIYKGIMIAVENLEEEAIIITDSNVDFNNVNRAYTAYFLDNEDVFFVLNEYDVSMTNFRSFHKTNIDLQYTNNKEHIEKQKQKIELKVNEVISEVIKDGMSDFEKEVAVHDYLVSHVAYYNCDNDIPFEKHTVYGALIEREAVCDGISKAFQLILKKLNIRTITVTGVADGMSHAWNKVKLENNWYNVDVTSDSTDDGKYVNHIYFNLTDEKISKTHTVDNLFIKPIANSEKYNYYEYMDYTLSSGDLLRTKVYNLIQTTNGDVLEFRLKDNYYDIQDIVSKLFELNFNNYKSSGISSMKYFYQDDIYIFKKEI